MRSVTDRQWKEKGAEHRGCCQAHSTHNEHVVLRWGLHSALLHLSKTPYVQKHTSSSRWRNEELWKQSSFESSTWGSLFVPLHGFDRQNKMSLRCLSVCRHLHPLSRRKQRLQINLLMFARTCLYPLGSISLPSHHQLMCVALKSNLLSFKWIWSPSAELAKPHINSPAAPF